MSDKRIKRIRDFWFSNESQRYSKKQIIEMAEDDIAILLKEIDEIKKIINLLNVTEINFDKDGN